MIRTVTPNPSFDHTFQVEQLEPGVVCRADTVSIAAAGKGVNVARDVVANGGDAIAVVPGSVVDGAAFSRELEHHGVGCVVVDREATTRRNITIIDQWGTTTKVNDAGVTVDDELAVLLIAAASADPDAFVAACGSLPPGTDPSLFVEIGKALPAPERTLAIDTSGRALSECLDMPCLLAKPNRRELEELIGARLHTYGDLVQAARDLVDRGWKNVLVSLGPAGAVLVNERGAWAGSTQLDRPVNTVGAGDALVAGFLLEPAGNETSLSSALALARAAVSSVAAAGMKMSAADRSAVELRPIIESDSLGEETG